MNKRGRKSSADLATRPVLIEAHRPAPPADFGEAESAVWKDTVGTMPLGWFSRAQYPLLIAYCRHAVRANQMAAHLASFNADWIKEEGGPEMLNKLLAMAERETRALPACARSMRLTQQAQIQPRSAGRALTNDHGGPKLWESKPWDDDYEPDPTDRFFTPRTGD